MLARIKEYQQFFYRRRWKNIDRREAKKLTGKGRTCFTGNLKCKYPDVILSRTYFSPIFTWKIRIFLIARTITYQLPVLCYMYHFKLQGYEISFNYNLQEYYCAPTASRAFTYTIACEVDMITQYLLWILQLSVRVQRLCSFQAPRPCSLFKLL